jgi:hypothetical protein
MMVKQTEHVFINNYTEHVFINIHTATGPDFDITHKDCYKMALIETVYPTYPLDFHQITSTVLFYYTVFLPHVVHLLFSAFKNRVR